MSPWLPYSIVMIAYLPGVLALVFSRKLWGFPIICFTFVGMFTFNAAGSLGVFSDEKLFRIAFDTHEVSDRVVLLLVFQAIIFYLICGLYAFFRGERIVEAKTTSSDITALTVSAILVIAISCLYYSKTGIFLIQLTLDGSMNASNALEYRQKYVYGLSGWPFFNLAFVFIPIFLSNYALIVFLSGYQHRYIVSLMALSVAFAASFSMGSKGGALGFLLSLSVTYISYLGMTGRSPFRIFRSGPFLAFAILAFGSMVGGYLYTTPDDLRHVSVGDRIVHRIFVAYPETLAAAVDYAEKRGGVEEAVLPTMRGLLRHSQINLSAVLHEYQAGAPGGVSVPFAAEAYVMYGWVSSFLLIPIVFITVVAIQEVALRLRQGMMAISFSAIYAYLALQLSLNGMFSTFYNFMYPGTLLTIFTITVVVAALCRGRWGGFEIGNGLNEGRQA